MRIALLITAYNNAPVLRHCLTALTVQRDREFEVVIADDGSNDSVRELLGSRNFAALRIRHVWHTDRGYRRAEILNRAIAATDADYLVMTDADCLPRDDFIARHRQLARRGTFISGGIVNIPIAVHQQFSDDDITSQRVFDPAFLQTLDPSLAKQRRRLTRDSVWIPFWNLLTHRVAVMRGNNCAAWRDDLLAVNGFDQSFTKYGSEDRDLGVRLHNLGRRGRMLKYSTVALHLDHPRPYVDPTAKQENRERFRRRRRERISWIDTGMSQNRAA